MQNNFVRNNFGQITQFQFNFNLNFFFGNRPRAPKSRLPLKRAVAWIISSILTLLTGGAVQAPLVARPVVKIISPANGSTFASGSTVPLVAIVKTTEGTIKRVEFYDNGSRIGKTGTYAPK